MTAAEVLEGLLKINLASGAGILAVVALRKAARARFGARLAYGLWLLPVLAGAAVLLPARQVVVARSVPPVLDAAVQVGRTLRTTPLAASPRLDAPLLLICLWLAGTAVATLLMAGLQWRFVRRSRQGGVGPAVVGMIAPRIVVPGDFGERYGAEERALVLAHEEAHLARQDSRLNGLVAATQCLCWFNPLVHLGARLMRFDQELACDAAVVSRFPSARRAYAEVLMKAQASVLPLPVGCHWPAKTQHPLVERIAMLKHERVGRGRRWSGAAALAVLCVGTGVAAWASQPAQVRVTIRPAPNVGGLPSSTDSTAPPVVARDGADKALNRVAAAAKRAPAPSPPAPQSPPVEAPFVLAQATPAPAAGADAVRNFTLSPPPGADAPTGQWKAGWIGKTPNAPAPDPEQQAAARVFAEKALESVAGRALPDHGPIAITADHIVVDKNAGVTRYEGNATMVGDARELYGVQLLADGKPVNPRPGVPPIGPDTAGRFTLFAADSLELKFALNGDGSVGRLQRVDTHGGVLFGVGPARAAR